MPPLESGATGFFSTAGRNCHFHRPFYFDDSPSDYPLIEHPLTSLNLYLALTYALFISRDPSTVKHPTLPLAPVAGPLRPPSASVDHPSVFHVRLRCLCFP